MNYDIISFWSLHVFYLWENVLNYNLVIEIHAEDWHNIFIYRPYHLVKSTKIIFVYTKGEIILVLWFYNSAKAILEPPEISIILKYSNTILLHHLSKRENLREK